MKLRYVPFALGLAAMASAAVADDQTIVLSQTGAGMFSALFSETHSLSGAFADTFTFSLPSTATAFLGSGTVTFSSLSGPASLVLATFVGANGAEVDSPADPSSIAIPSSLSYTGFTAPFVLTVLGSAGDPFSDPVALSATYSGTVTFNAPVAAVPEPGTYALMLAGLGALGFAGRPRRIKVFC